MREVTPFSQIRSHMLLWVDNSESKEGKVSAIVPREVGDVNLRDMVLKY